MTLDSFVALNVCAALNNGFPNIVPKISNTSTNENYRLDMCSLQVRILWNRYAKKGR